MLIECLDGLASHPIYGVFLPGTQYSQDRLWIHRDPEQDNKAVEYVRANGKW